MTARLIVRRVKRLNPRAGRGQDELFALYRYHAIFTDNPFELVQAEEQHRDHAIMEQVNADLIAGPLAHMPSGVFTANAAWVTLAAITHNLLRATGCLASAFHAKARGATLRRHLIAVPARLARHSRGHITMHLPTDWRWQTAWLNTFDHAHGPPRAHAAWPAQKPLVTAPSTTATVNRALGAPQPRTGGNVDKPRPAHGSPPLPENNTFTCRNGPHTGIGS